MFYHAWGKTALIILLIGIISLPLLSCGNQAETFKKDGVSITEEEFVEEVRAVYEDTLAELKELNYYGSPLTYSDDPQELLEEENLREGSGEEWRQLYEGKREFYWNVHGVYNEALDRIDSLTPSKEYADATITLSLVLETIWTWAYSEFSIYDLCLQKAIRIGEWSSHQEESGYMVYEGLLQQQEDSMNLLDEIIENESEQGWAEVQDKFDFIEYRKFFEAS